ncbi:hypothetical protein BGW36DRAFT_296294 [Talaromyces proteolyticus]|uniref:Uncharacterized protein n=1 Tax=Talaromyces proteolyticus TaxID=1131652 RepID=A0AAD4KPP5_9EURO|nr:uncharacterized protein BGW36DRAFT_296294 [Talaromyces proteolyticus]KAH8697568.1 hypothetical protein BGW36DRAFT_296294 [Talaromyces proteolyticus]
MLSSSESASPPGARTPTYNTVSELSPPGSQTASHHGGLGDATIESPTSAFGKALSVGGPDDKSSNTQAKEPTAWSSQRAQEEYGRALESVVDRDFSLKEFGDPFDESDMLDVSSA